MNSALKSLIRRLGRPHLVEFDYRDATGLHHGRCYVRCMLAGHDRVRRMMSSFGYENIHIA